MSRPLRLGILLILALGVGWTAREVLFAPKDGPVRAAVRDYLALRRVEEHKGLLLAAAEESGVDAYLLAAVMIAESSGRLGAKSHRGALGLFQLMPTTAKWRAELLGLPAPTEEELLSDGLLNARLGADNMAWLLDTYDGDVERALVAYNLGPHRLAQYVRKAGGWESWREERLAAGNSELFGYAHKVMRYRDGFRERRILAP